MLEQVFLAIMAMVLTIVSSGLAIIAWNRSRRDYRKAFALLMMAEVIIVWGYTMDVASGTLSDKLMWNSVEYIGYLSAVPLFFTFAIQFAWDVKLSTRRMTLIFLPAGLLYILMLTNPYHHLFYVSTAVTSDVYRSFYAVYGPAFYAYMAYAFALLLGGLFALVYHYLKASKTHRSSVGITAMACGLGVGVVIVNYIMIYSIPGSLFVVLGFLASGILLFIGAFGFELFSMVPFALELAMDTMRGGVIIVDDRGDVLFLNPAAVEMVGKTEVYGQDIRDVLPDLPYDALGQNGPGPQPDTFYEVRPGRYFEVQIISIRNHDEHVLGRTIYLREVTAELTAQEDAKLSREKLELMNGITRHDVNNQLTILEGHLALAGMKAGKGAVADHIAISSQAAQLIRMQMQFARDYQELGMQVPIWHDIGETFKAQAASRGIDGISLVLETNGAEVYADPMLERVFFNLIDNSIAHGEKVSRITVLARSSPTGLEIVYTDDGAGIPAEMKERLFTKGFGRNSGLGMYLSKEILAHGGMHIREDGVPGKGARFIIDVPVGKFRFSAPNAQKAPSGESGVASGTSGP